MGSKHGNPKSGIKINGKDALEYHPDDVKAIINSDETGIIRAIFESELMDSDDENAIALPDNYASHAGRPSLTEVPYMRSENDGYPYIPGHNPMCDGKPYYGGRCKCKYDAYNKSIGHRPMWPGGPDIDDFDM
jgi:hypothetical protein